MASKREYRVHCVSDLAGHASRTIAIDDHNFSGSLILSEFNDINMCDPIGYANLMSTYNLTGNQIINTINAYRNATLGTKCK